MPGVLDVVSGIGSLFAKKPKLPPWDYDTPGSALGKVTAGNLQNLPGATKLGTAVDTYNLAEMKRLAEGVEGLKPTLDLTRKIGESWAQGLMSDAERRYFESHLAAKNLGAGVAGSVYSKLGDVMAGGKNVYQRMQAGLNTLQNWTAMTSSILLPKPFDITKQLFDAKTGTDYLFREKEQRWKGQLMQATAPAQAPAWSQGLASVSSMFGGGGGGGGFGSIMSMFGGGGGGGGGGGLGGIMDMFTKNTGTNTNSKVVPDYGNLDYWYWPNGGGGGGGNMSSLGGVNTDEDVKRIRDEMRSGNKFSLGGVNTPGGGEPDPSYGD